jgi:hypothetical protein
MSKLVWKHAPGHLKDGKKLAHNTTTTTTFNFSMLVNN